MNYPSKINPCSYGRSLIATTDLLPGTVVEKLEGFTVRRDEIPEEEKCYAIWIDDDKWMIIKSNSRYINHSCSPNCRITDELNIIANNFVRKGEELTISYNIVHKGENPGLWDEKWNFICQCGSQNCQGIINQYITEDGLPFVYSGDKKVKIGNNLNTYLKPIEIQH
ncbi:MAG: SET domain-containing protein-lysine N-methyltransferase [Candidatus Hermodarchaeota archaeon]